MATTTKHDETLDQKREERRQQQAGDSPSEKRKVVMDGAKLQCPYASGPGKLVVDSNEIKLQDQLWATEEDNNNMINLKFNGPCGHPKFSGQTPPPCQSVIFLSKWQDIGTTKVQEHTVLIKDSKITCNPTPNSATPKPGSSTGSSNEEQQEEKPEILDAYFVKLKSEDKGKKITTEKVTERGISYTVGLIVETKNLAGKKVKVRIKSGKKKVLSDINSAISFIDLEDKKSKSEFEVTVDNYNNNKLTNKADFKDKAVLKIMLNQKLEDLSFDLAKNILADSEKTALLYIEVESTEANVEYKGQDSGAGKNNAFLKEDGKYFTVKYLEQAWLVTAREEQEKGVSEGTHCQYIVDNYHDINRQHKPSGCKTITNAWCASFAGWCLRQNNFSAQCDPGAYTYGHLNTRYRAGAKKNPTDKSVLKVEEFSDPVWAKAAGKCALGSVCVVRSGKHVTFAVAQKEDGTVLYLGGNQGDKVSISPYAGWQSSVYPTEYEIRATDNELPVYYGDIGEASAT